MKKTGLVLLMLLIFSAVSGFAWNDIFKISGFETYLDCFQSSRFKPKSQKQVNIDSDYIDAMSDEDYYRFSAISNDLEMPDTCLEVLLALYYSPEIVAIQPTEAARLLPQNDKTSGLRLALAVLRELTDVKFFNPQDTAAIGRYEGMIKFIQDKHGLSRAEIDNYYRDAVRAEIMPIIQTAFSENTVMITNKTVNHSYDITLTRGENGQYTVKYSGANVDENDEIKIINGNLSAPSLNGLVDELNRTGLFDRNSLNDFRKQFENLPVTYYAARKARGEADALELVTEAITDFYADPSSQDNLNTLLGIEARLFISNTEQNSPSDFASRAYDKVLLDLWRELYDLVLDKTTERGGRNIPIYTRYPADPRFAVFGGR